MQKSTQGCVAFKTFLSVCALGASSVAIVGVVSKTAGNLRPCTSDAACVYVKLFPDQTWDVFSPGPQKIFHGMLPAKWSQAKTGGTATRCAAGDRWSFTNATHSCGPNGNKVHNHLKRQKSFIAMIFFFGLWLLFIWIHDTALQLHCLSVPKLLITHMIVLGSQTMTVSLSVWWALGVAEPFAATTKYSDCLCWYSENKLQQVVAFGTVMGLVYKWACQIKVFQRVLVTGMHCVISRTHHIAYVYEEACATDNLLGARLDAIVFTDLVARPPCSTQANDGTSSFITNSMISRNFFIALRHTVFVFELMVQLTLFVLCGYLVTCILNVTSHDAFGLLFISAEILILFGGKMVLNKLYGKETAIAKVLMCKPQKYIEEMQNGRDMTVLEDAQRDCPELAWTLTVTNVNEPPLSEPFLSRSLAML